jgi:hypothetical protein
MITASCANAQGGGEVGPTESVGAVAPVDFAALAQVAASDFGLTLDAEEHSAFQRDDLAGPVFVALADGIGGRVEESVFDGRTPVFFAYLPDGYEPEAGVTLRADYYAIALEPDRAVLLNREGVSIVRQRLATLDVLRGGSIDDWDLLGGDLGCDPLCPGGFNVCEFSPEACDGFDFCDLNPAFCGQDLCTISGHPDCGSLVNCYLTPEDPACDPNCINVYDPTCWPDPCDRYPWGLGCDPCEYLAPDDPHCAPPPCPAEECPITLIPESLACIAFSIAPRTDPGGPPSDGSRRHALATEFLKNVESGEVFYVWPVSTPLPTPGLADDDGAVLPVCLAYST